MSFRSMASLAKGVYTVQGGEWGEEVGGGVKLKQNPSDEKAWSHIPSA
jgi:hypothetical protein